VRAVFDGVADAHARFVQLNQLCLAVSNRQRSQDFDARYFGFRFDEATLVGTPYRPTDGDAVGFKACPLPTSRGRVGGAEPEVETARRRVDRLSDGELRDASPAIGGIRWLR
jgi:hypothetical protein